MSNWALKFIKPRNTPGFEDVAVSSWPLRASSNEPQNLMQFYCVLRWFSYMRYLAVRPHLLCQKDLALEHYSCGMLNFRASLCDLDHDGHLSFLCSSTHLLLQIMCKENKSAFFTSHPLNHSCLLYISKLNFLVNCLFLYLTVCVKFIEGVGRPRFLIINLSCSVCYRNGLTIRLLILFILKI